MKHPPRFAILDNADPATGGTVRVKGSELRHMRDVMPAWPGSGSRAVRPGWHRILGANRRLLSQMQL